MAKKLTRLQRSQNAHWDLRQRAADVPGVRGEILFKYHKVILDKQKQKRRRSGENTTELYKKRSY